MRSKFSGPSLLTKSLMTAVLVASLSGIAVGIANGPSGAASTPAVRATTRAHTAAATATPAESAILYFAASQAGVANCSGGGGYYGPTAPAGSGCSAPGFGCMSLAQYAVYQGTGGKVSLPINAQLPGVGKEILPPKTGTLWSNLKPGDVTYWGGTLSWYYHSGVYAGNGYIWDAVGTETVGLRSFSELLSAPYNYDYDGAIQFPTVPLVSVTTASLPGGTLDHTYSTALHATAGTAPYQWSLAKGTLPTGLKLSTAGLISGRATKAGTYSFGVRVTDTKTSKLVRMTATKTLSIKIIS